MITIAVASEDSLVAEHFGHCKNFWLFKTEDGKIVEKESIANPGHKPGFLPNFLADKGVNIIISGGMGKGAIDIFNDRKVTVITGATGETEKSALDYLSGKLISSDSVCQKHEHKDECGH